jgi:hypothetical protein
MAISPFRLATSKVCLLPTDDKLKSRCFVQQYNRDSSEPKVGQFDEIVQFVKDEILITTRNSKHAGIAVKRESTRLVI